MITRLPKNIQLQNGLTATVYSVFDKRVRLVLEACLHLSPGQDLDALTSFAYVIKVRLKRHVVYVVYTKALPSLLMLELQQDLSPALSGSDFVVCNNLAYRRVTIRHWNSSFTVLRDPRAKMFLESIRDKRSPAISILTAPA
jgi:hypothetical protein